MLRSLVQIEPRSRGSSAGRAIAATILAAAGAGRQWSGGSRVVTTVAPLLVENRTMNPTVPVPDLARFRWPPCCRRRACRDADCRGRRAGRREGHPRRHHRARHVARRRLHRRCSTTPRPTGRSGRAARSSRRSPAAAPTSRPAATASQGFTQDAHATRASRSSTRSRRCCAKVDVVLLESVDGRPHLEQARPVFDGGQAGVHRQADRRLAGRRGGDLPSWPKKHNVAVVLAARRCGSARHRRRCATADEASATSLGCVACEPLLARAAPPRPVLVRHPRRRDAVHRSWAPAASR